MPALELEELTLQGIVGLSPREPAPGRGAQSEGRKVAMGFDSLEASGSLD